MYSGIFLGGGRGWGWGIISILFVLRVKGEAVMVGILRESQCFSLLNDYVSLMMMAKFPSFRN